MQIKHRIHTASPEAQGAPDGRHLSVVLTIDGSIPTGPEGVLSPEAEILAHELGAIDDKHRNRLKPGEEATEALLGMVTEARAQATADAIVEDRIDPSQALLALLSVNDEGIDHYVKNKYDSKIRTIPEDKRDQVIDELKTEAVRKLVEVGIANHPKSNASSNIVAQAGDAKELQLRVLRENISLISTPEDPGVELYDRIEKLKDEIANGHISPDDALEILYQTSGEYIDNDYSGPSSQRSKQLRDQIDYSTDNGITLYTLTDLHAKAKEDVKQDLLAKLTPQQDDPAQVAPTRINNTGEAFVEPEHSTRWTAFREKFKRDASSNKNKHVQRLAKLSSGAGLLAVAKLLQDKVPSRMAIANSNIGVGSFVANKSKRFAAHTANTFTSMKDFYDNTSRRGYLSLGDTLSSEKFRKVLKISGGIGAAAIGAVIVYKNLNGLQDLAHNVFSDGPKGGNGATHGTGSKGFGSSLSEHMPGQKLGKSTGDIMNQATDAQGIEALDVQLGMPTHYENGKLIPEDVKQNLRQAALDIANDHGVDIGSDEFNNITNSSFELSTIHDAQEAVQVAHPDIIQGTPEYAELIDNVFGLANEARQYKPGNSGLTFDQQFSRFVSDGDAIIQSRGLTRRQFDEQFIAFMEHLKRLQEAEDILDEAGNLKTN